MTSTLASRGTSVSCQVSPARLLITSLPTALRITLPSARRTSPCPIHSALTSLPISGSSVTLPLFSPRFWSSLLVHVRTTRPLSSSVIRRPCCWGLPPLAILDIQVFPPSEDLTALDRHG